MDMLYYMRYVDMFNEYIDVLEIYKKRILNVQAPEKIHYYKEIAVLKERLENLKTSIVTDEDIAYVKSRFASLSKTLPM